MVMLCRESPVVCVGCQFSSRSPVDRRPSSDHVVTAVVDSFASTMYKLASKHCTAPTTYVPYTVDYGSMNATDLRILAGSKQIETVVQQSVHGIGDTSYR